MSLSENCQQILCGVAVAGAVATTAVFGVGVATGVLELVAGGANLALAVRREQQDRCERLLNRVRKQLEKDFDLWLESELKSHPEGKQQVEDAFASLDHVLPLIKPTTAELVEAGLNGERLFAIMRGRLPSDNPFQQPGVHQQVLRAVVLNTFALVRSDRDLMTDLTSLSFERVFICLDGLDSKLDQVLVGQLELKLQAARHQAELLDVIAHERGVDSENLRPLFEAVGRDVPVANFEHAVREAVAELLLRARAVPQVFNDAEEIARAITAAREKLSRLDTNGAIEHLRNARAEQAAIRDERQRGEARLAAEEAEILRLVHRFEEAHAAYKTATELADDDSWVRVRLGDFHRSRGRYEDAILEYTHACRIAESQSDKRTLMVGLNRSASAHQRAGQIDRALENYLLGDAIAEEIGALEKNDEISKIDLSISKINIGRIYAEKKSFNKALSYFESGAEIAYNLDPDGQYGADAYRRRFVVSVDIGNVHRNQTKLEKAELAYQSGLTAARSLIEKEPDSPRAQRDLFVALGALAQLYADTDRTGIALQLAEEALSTNTALISLDAENVDWKNDRDFIQRLIATTKLRISPSSSNG